MNNYTLYTCVTKKKNNIYYSIEYDISGLINIPNNKKHNPVKIYSNKNIQIKKQSDIIFDLDLDDLEKKQTLKKHKEFMYAKKKLDYMIYINDITNKEQIDNIYYLYIYNSYKSYNNYKTIIRNIIKGKWNIDFGYDKNDFFGYLNQNFNDINDSLLELYNHKYFINKRIQSSVLSILDDQRTIDIEVSHLDTYKIIYGCEPRDCYLCIIDVIIDGSIYINMNEKDFTHFLYKKVLFLKDYFRQIINDTNDEYLFTYYIFKVSLKHNQNKMLSNCFDDILYIFYCEEIDLITDESLLKLRENIYEKYSNTLFFKKINKLLTTLDID